MTAGIKANVDGSAAIQVGGTDVIGLDTTGNINIPTSGARITGDFSNATVANRVAFQTSTVNGGTQTIVIPNGSGTVANFGFFNNSDPSNAAGFFVGTANAGTEARLNSTISGTGSYLPMTFYTGGSERMRVDTSGNVGIGTSSPAHKLDVRGSGNTYLRIEDTQANGYNAATLYKNDQRQFRVGVLGTVGGFTNGALVVYDETAAAWRMVIDSGGNLLINATTRASLEKVNITSDGASQEGLIIVNTNTAAGTHTAIGFRRPSSTTVGNITTTLSSTAYVTSSDYRLKENVQPMTGALSKVAALKPCAYTWKIDGSSGQGFIAHELAEVVPDAVSGEKDAVNEDGSIKPQGIDTSFLVATLTAAIQEQQQMIETLQAKVAALEGA